MRSYSLAYLTATRSTAPASVAIAAASGYSNVGLRLKGNAPGAPFQELIGRKDILAETLAVMRDTGVGVFDIEIVRIAEGFQLEIYLPLFETGAALSARAVLVAIDDTNQQRAAHHYARLCECAGSFGMTADLEFMPWTAVKDASEALETVKSAGMPEHAGILVDALHFGRSTSSLSDVRGLPQHHLHYAQICDAQAGLYFTTAEMIHTAREERELPGDGSIDIQGLFKALPADIPVSVEIPNFRRTAGMDDKNWASIALQASRTVLEDVQ